uniref:MADF domain-containing protein n=1 Tax=Panagrolaimus sp. JU765 TaxID=591449 RepID=A0AC34QUB1_9BILA
MTEMETKFDVSLGTKMDLSLGSNMDLSIDIKEPKPEITDLGSKTDLIEMVKGYKELYDKNDPLYKNNSHKGVLWASIAKNLGGTQSAKKVREQFSYMRRRFEEEYHARKNGLPRPKLPDPDSANYRKPLFVYEQLTFLEPYIQTERESSYDEHSADVENHPGTSSFFDDNITDLSDPNILFDYVRQWTTDANIQIDPTTGEILPGDIKEIKECPPAKRKRKNNVPPKKSKTTLTPPSNNSTSAESPPSQDLKNVSLLPNGNHQNETIDNDVMLQFAKTITENFMQGQTNQTTNISIDEDECNLFGRQVAMDLKRLNTQNRALARFRINKILMEMTVQEFHGDGTNPLNFD